MSILVIDVGTSGLRAAVVRPDGHLHGLHHRAFPPQTPFPGLVEFDASAMSAAVLEVATAALTEAGTVTAVGVTAQRASTVVWDRATGEPIAPGLGWQDLRTVIQCIVAKSEHGISLAPNQSATKIAWILENVPGARDRDLCFGTVDSWLAWTLSGGTVHVTDRSNAAVTGLLKPDGSDWSTSVCAALGIPPSMLPRLVDTSGVCAEAIVLPGAPALAALAGDQQASLIGQSCVATGQTKITFGTGGMLDTVTGATAPASGNRSANGTFPIVAWSRDGHITWGTEAIMLSAGTNVEWLVSDLGILASPEESHEVASQCATTDGVVYVPALMGLGTPHWDYGARGALLGLTRGSGRAQITRAVLEGVAHRGADLVEAAEAEQRAAQQGHEGGHTIDTLRIDGGMSRNPTFVQALATATGRRVEVSRHTEATTLGAAYLAGLATGVWGGLDDIAAAWSPSAVVEPDGPTDRDRWRTAVQRSQGWIPDLSALDF